MRRARTRSASATAPTRIALILRALGIGPGDEVITTPLSAAYTALADHDGRRAAGVRRHRSVAADARSASRSRARSRPRTRAILPGAPVRPAGRHGAPSSGSRRATTWRSSRTAARRTSRRRAGRPVGTIGVAGAFSFYPTKNLGALGDGGAVVTNDRRSPIGSGACATAGRRDRYHHEELGVNSRLDEMQAAILRARLPCLPSWTARRRRARRRAIGRRSPADRSTCRRSAMPGTSTICSWSASATGAALQPHLARRRHRDAGALSGADPAPAGARRRERRTTVPRRRVRATKCCRCRSIRR